jgi:DNA-binding transcriptional LysR family regulator
MTVQRGGSCTEVVRTSARWRTMDTRTLLGFVAVAEELSFRRAAERLHQSQPGLSRLIAKLEREVGVQLLDRSTTHVDLTEAGRVFLDHAQSVLVAMEQAVRAANQDGAGKSTRLRVGMSDWTEQPVSRVLQALHRSADDTRVDIDHAEAESLVADLCNDRFDVVFCRGAPLDRRIEAASLADEPLLAAAPAGHPVHDRRPFDMSALAGQPLLLFPRSFAPWAHDRIADLCAGTGFEPHIVHETVALGPMEAMIAMGAGVALVPASIAHRFDPAHVRFRRIHAAAATMPLTVVRRRGETSTVVHRLLNIATEVLATSGTASPAPRTRAGI